MNRLILLICVVWTTTPPTTSPADKALEDVEKRLLRQVKHYQSFSAALVLKIDLSGAGSWDQGEGKGTVEYLVKGEKLLFRADMTNDSTTTIGGIESKRHDVHSIYCDGQYTYDIGETNGEKMAFKNKLDPLQSAVPTPSYFEVLKKEYEAKLLPDEKLAGKDVWVLEARPKDLSKTPASRMVSYFRKDLGLLIKTVSYDKYNRPFQTMILTDIKVNPKLDPERFVYKLPEGVELIDGTK